MTKIKVGLYKDKETGEYAAMVDETDNERNVHNGKFKQIKQFTHIEESRETILRREIKSLKDSIGTTLQLHIVPVFLESRTSDTVSDKIINLLRAELYDFICKRREVLRVNEFKID
jgi:hypothetical protein